MAEMFNIISFYGCVRFIYQKMCRYSLLIQAVIIRIAKNG